MIEIVQNGHPTLREEAALVTEKEFGTDELRAHITDMNTALETQADGVALAAPQIALSKQIFVVSPKALRDDKHHVDLPLTYINPTITKQSRDRKKMDEGCLSVRPLYGKVRRSSRATVTAQDIDGNHFTVEGRGLIAQIFQHETDHLHGILFIDKATDVVTLDPPNPDAHEA